MAEEEERFKNIAVNRRARFEYHIEETFEAGLALQGTEVKSLREGQCSLQDAFARIEKNEVWLISAHINPFEKGNRNNHDPVRMRKLLLHKFEIKHLFAKISQKGMTLVPLRLYWKSGRAKIEIGLGKGKKLYDKREDLKSKDANREMSRHVGTRMKRGASEG